MNNYIVTFYSHYDALTLYNSLKGKCVRARLMPAPRKVSTSCGTCLAFSIDGEIGLYADEFWGHEIEAVFIDMGDEFRKIDIASRKNF